MQTHIPFHDWCEQSVSGRGRSCPHKKTEAVKALGRLMGRQVKVFNCDEGIDIKSMGRIFIGLVKCGAWGCFDEFNRLAEQTLSVVSKVALKGAACACGKIIVRHNDIRDSLSS